MSNRRTAGRFTRRWRHRLLLTAGLATFVVGVYTVVVRGGGVLIGRTDSPSLPLSVLATTAVALCFAPVQAILERVAARAGQAGVATPYDVLSRFSETVTSPLTDELPARMATLLAQGTGARWAQVWLTVSGRPTLAAAWPPDSEQDRTPPTVPSDSSDSSDAADSAGVTEGRRSLAVRHAGELLGVLRLQERPGLPLTAVEERLFAGLAAQAGLALRLVRLRTELEARHEELVERAGELTSSRERLIAAQDAEQRRLERDLHDGAQQHLVALTVNLRLVQAIAARSPDRARQVLATQADAAEVAIEMLLTLSRGIYPRLLSDQGLIPALRSAVATSPIPVTIAPGDARRFPAPVEAALYFCCLEAVQNAAKHSGAQNVSVNVGQTQDQWLLSVADNGSGFEELRPGAATGAGLVNMRDRLDALGGMVTVGSVLGAGTTVTATVPRSDASEPGASPAPSWAG